MGRDIYEQQEAREVLSIGCSRSYVAAVGSLSLSFYIAGVLVDCHAGHHLCVVRYARSR